MSSARERKIAGNGGRRFGDELIRDVPVHPVTIETARLAGRIEGDQAIQGVTIDFEDLLIAATALQLGFGVATATSVTSRSYPA